MKKFRYKIYFLGLLTLLFSSCYIEKEKTDLANDFLDFYFKSVLKKTNPVVLKGFDNHQMDHCWLRNAANLSVFGFSNNKTLDTLNSTLDAQYITKNNLPNYLIPNSWFHFKKKYGEGYYVISRPIINESLNMVCFYYNFYCGERCGNGELVVYKKTKTSWELIKVYCQSVN